LDRQVIFLGSGSSVPIDPKHVVAFGNLPHAWPRTLARDINFDDSAAGDEAGSAPIMALWPGAPKGSIAASAPTVIYDARYSSS